ncbi:MAG: glycoside hydrolase family 32 protein [Bacteroidia bacterium]|nr:glycoside hydrolase family 32 protein [Bacteroidia bacterium]
MEKSQAQTITEGYYQEAHRPRFHFSPPAKWMNDPNGMFFYEGEYHLFYQYYPDDVVWGPMHWGHAVSTDLIHWDHLPIALYPDSMGYIFSGSAVVDHKNTSGLAPEGQSPLIAIFTYHDPEGEKAGRNDYQYQGIAYSLDKGRTWTKYKGNPVVPNPGLKDFRDPKVFWYEKDQHWVMIFARGDRVQIYNSPNLIDWVLTGEFGETYGGHGGVWECPDLFELAIDGNPENKKWVMLLSINPGGPNKGSATQYFVGDFDGKTFISDNPGDVSLWLDYGTDNYAGVTWSDVPASDGRRLFIGWMSNWLYANRVPTDPWRSAMTIPRTLQLVSTEAGVRIKTEPVAELGLIRGEEKNIPPQTISGAMPITKDSGNLAELVLSFDTKGTTATEFGVELTNGKGEKVRIGYEKAGNRFYIDRRQSGRNDFSEEFAGIHYAPHSGETTTLSLHLLVDVASVELFAQEGLVVMTEIFFPSEPFTQMNLYSEGGEAVFTGGKATELKGVW